MSLFRQRWFAVVLWLGLMIVIGLAGMIYVLTLFGIMHAASARACTLEGNTNALVSIGVRSSDTPRAGQC